MANFDFKCKKCEKTYEALTPYDETGKYADVQCPYCESKKKEKLISGCAFAFGNPVGTDIWNSDSKGHDYRFKYNMPNVAAQREAAMKKSHMGTDPYNHIDDISSGKYFGEVK